MKPHKHKAKQVEIHLLDKNYRLYCPEEEETLLQTAVAHVDAEMHAIRNAGRVRSREYIAVMVALNLGIEMAKMQAGPTGGAAVGNTAIQGGGNSERLRHLLRRLDAVLGEQN